MGLLGGKKKRTCAKSVASKFCFFFLRHPRRKRSRPRQFFSHFQRLLSHYRPQSRRSLNNHQPVFRYVHIYYALLAGPHPGVPHGSPSHSCTSGVSISAGSINKKNMTRSCNCYTKSKRHERKGTDRWRDRETNSSVRRGDKGRARGEAGILFPS